MSTSTIPDLSKLAFWTQPRDAREADFRRLRDEAPVWWHDQPESQTIDVGEFGTGGFWAITRYEDIKAISRDPERFCSGKGIMLEDVPQEFLDAAQSFIAMDGERHRRIRGLVSAGFTPRQVRHLEDGVRADARTIVDDLASHEGGDFVELVAKRLPLMTIMRMLGVPEDERERIVHQADAMVSWNDPDYLQGREPLEVIGTALFTLHEACNRYISERRETPGDDLLSAIVHAEVDGERLTDQEIAAFFVLLCVAGNDTTRHTTSHAMLALTEERDQRALLLEDFDGRIDAAVEEFIRWASPVMTMRRTVTEDVVVRGEKLSAGEKLVLFYPSGNRDERAIEDPHRFDITRDPNRHLGFGGGGPHYCMGAALARLQLRTLFGELLGRYPDLEVTEPNLLVGNFINGINRMPMHRGAPA